MKTIHRLLAGLTLLLTLFALPAAHAAPGDVDPLNAAVVGTYVLASVVQPDGKTIIAGVFSSVLGQPRNNIARLNADGTLDGGFNPNAGGAVYSVAVQADGQILLGGLFTTMGGTARNRIARVDATGALDASFNPNANSDVYSVARIGSIPGWQLPGLTLSGTGQLRARGRTLGGYQNGGSGLVEAVTSYSFAPPPNTAPTTMVAEYSTNPSLSIGLITSSAL